MAKSKAKRYREKLVREGKQDVTIKRGTWNGVNPYSKKTKTRAESLINQTNKHRKNHTLSNYDENGSFPFNREARIRVASSL